jgi:hypothetical protein
LVITRLTGLIDASAIAPMSSRLSLTRRVILWCVEEYFGCLGGNVLRRTAVRGDTLGIDTLSDAAAVSPA